MVNADGNKGITRGIKHSGYQPETLDLDKPPQGGSGVPNLEPKWQEEFEDFIFLQEDDFVPENLTIGGLLVELVNKYFPDSKLEERGQKVRIQCRKGEIRITKC